MKKDKVKVRRTWKINPTTRVEQIKIKYDRAKEKEEIQEELTQSLEHLSDPCIDQVCSQCADLECTHFCHNIE